MLVIISILQSFPSCLCLNRLFVLWVKKLMETECNCAFISVTAFIKQHSSAVKSMRNSSDISESYFPLIVWHFCLTCSSHTTRASNAAWRMRNQSPTPEWKQPLVIYAFKGHGIHILIYYFCQSSYLRKWAWRMTNRCFSLSISCHWSLEYYKICCTTVWS